MIIERVIVPCFLVQYVALHWKLACWLVSKFAKKCEIASLYVLYIHSTCIVGNGEAVQVGCGAALDCSSVDE
jgi:hypothetical protein